jgi:hypothetical protein
MVLTFVKALEDTSLEELFTKSSRELIRTSPRVTL